MFLVVVDPEPVVACFDDTDFVVVEELSFFWKVFLSGLVIYQMEETPS